MIGVIVFFAGFALVPFFLDVSSLRRQRRADPARIAQLERELLDTEDKTVLIYNPYTGRVHNHVQVHRYNWDDA